MENYILKLNNRGDNIHLLTNNNKFTLCGVDTVNLGFKQVEKFSGSSMYDFQPLANEYKKRGIFFCRKCFRKV